MNSRELGLVNTAVNSLLGMVGTQSTQQGATNNTFNKIFDKKVQYANQAVKKSESVQQPTQVNREKTTVNDAKYEEDRDAYVKSDMQKAKKPIEKATKDKVSESKNVEKTSKTEDAKKAEAIESEETEIVDESESVKEVSIYQELIPLLNNEEMTNEEKIDALKTWFGELTDTELKVLSNQPSFVKGLLDQLEGSIEALEQTLSALTLDGQSFMDVLNNVALESSGQVKEEANLVEGLDTADTDKLTEAYIATEEDAVEEVLTEKVTLEKPAEETPKVSKADQVKMTEGKAEKLEKTLTTATEVNTDSSTGRQSQQQSNTETQQSFAETLKFHTATVKTAAMKGQMAANPFEEKIMQQVIKGTQVSLNVGKDVSEMMIKLNPKDLGNVSLKISLKNEQLVAEFNVENKTVKEVLESRLEDLKTALSDKGFTIQGLDVSVNQDANDQFKSYEEFIKQQKSKKRFNGLEGVEEIGASDETAGKSGWQSLETTSAEINVLA